MMRTDKSGFSLTELLVSLVITGIIVLMLGAMSNVAFLTYKNLRNRSGVYNDSQFALQLIRENVRQSTTNPTYVNGCLTVVTSSNTFNFYVSGNSLVYSKGSGGCVAPYTPIISGVTNLVFTPNVNSLPLVTVTLSGQKNNVSFNYPQINVARRI